MDEREEEGEVVCSREGVREVRGVTEEERADDCLDCWRREKDKYLERERDERKQGYGARGAERIDETINSTRTTD